MTVGATIKKIRTQRNLTQKQLGELIGIDDATIRKYESGKLNAKPDTLKKIADALCVNVETLLFSDLNYNRAMHQLFRIIDTYGGEICFCDNKTNSRNVAVYFDKLAPFLEEYLDKKENLTPEEFDEYKNTFPDSSEVSQDILKSLDE